MMSDEVIGRAAMNLLRQKYKMKTNRNDVIETVYPDEQSLATAYYIGLVDGMEYAVDLYKSIKPEAPIPRGSPLGDNG